MKRTVMSVCVLAAAILLLALGCSTSGPEGSLTRVSSAFFSVPTSLTGTSTWRSVAARTATSDLWVAAAVTSYYAMIRDQVSFGVDAARSLKALFLELEQIRIGDEYLLDSDTDLTHTAGDGTKYRWTTEAPGTFFLEIWAASGTKSLELRFTLDGSRYSGTVIASPSSLGWTEPLLPVKLPDWVEAEFDTDADGLGTARLAISAQEFRYHEDLDPGLENALIELTRDSSGVVRMGSIVRGDNSRHFVWNGYLRDASNHEVLNTGAASETRYYVAAGVGSTANRATVYLGIPKGTVDATVFAANGIGSLVGDLFAARLNNDYDFDGAGDTAFDQGHEIINGLNTINSGVPLLDYSNTAAETLAALVAAQAKLPTANDTVDYLVDIMSVQNPAYFDSTTYHSYGASTPSGWPALSDAEAQALLPSVAQSAVDSMDIAFEDDSPPGF